MTNVCKWKTMCNLKNTIHYQRDASENWKSRYAFSAFIFFSFPYISFYFILFFENNCNLYFVNGNTLFHVKNQKKIQDFYSLNKLLLQ